MLHGHLIIAATNLDSHSVVFEPSVRLRLAGELADSSRQPEVGRNHCGPDGSTETLWPRNTYSTTGRRIPVVAFLVSSVPVNQTLNEDGSRIKARVPGVDWNPPPNTMRASVILLSRHI